METMEVLRKITREMKAVVYGFKEYRGLMDDDDLDQEICLIALEKMRLMDVTPESWHLFCEEVRHTLVHRLEAEIFRRSNRTSRQSWVQIYESPESAILRSTANANFCDILRSRMSEYEYIFLDALIGLEDSAIIDESNIEDYLQAISKPEESSPDIDQLKKDALSKAAVADQEYRVRFY